MKNYIYLFVILFLLISCNKKQEIRITALNPANGEPWPGLHYSITQEKTGAFSENYKVIHEGFLDANGKAVAQVKMKNASYRIDIEDPGNTCYENEVQYTFAKNDTNFDFVFELVPCGKLQINIQNTNCQGVSDTLSIYRTHSISDYYSNVPNPAIYTGCISIIGNLNNSPMGLYTYNGFAIHGGVSTPISDSIYLNEGETKIWNINY